MDKPNFIQGWKNKYRAIKIDNYIWGGWLADEGLHLFQKEIRVNGLPKYCVIKCFDSECFDGSLELMIKEGVTR